MLGWLPTCSTTNTAAGKPAGRRDNRSRRAYTPPAEAPMTTISRCTTRPLGVRTFIGASLRRGRTVTVTRQLLRPRPSPRLVERDDAELAVALDVGGLDGARA